MAESIKVKKGGVTRRVHAKFLPEWEAKGYVVVKVDSVADKAKGLIEKAKEKLGGK